MHCGGRDCDDDDPLVSDTRTYCADPTTVRRCAPEDVVDAPCLDVCDARTGACVAEACGDGVLHEGEECDDGNDVVGDTCDPDCRPRETCESSRDCPAARPLCSGRRDDGTFYCVARIAGAALGSTCSVDADCESSFCDPRQLLCTSACSEHDDCDFMGQQHWCGRGVRDPMRYEGTDFVPPVCHRGCQTSSVCASGRICRLLIGGSEPGIVVSHCDSPPGTRPIGGSCNGGEVFACEDNCHLPSFRCTSLCNSDERCPSTSPCRPIFPSFGSFPEWWDWGSPMWCDF
ncbi:MAG: hypothetical protein H6724_15595 [Sandaracinus sp.]|nr:hypothetical protein [Sandaracinus sp.]